MNDIVVTPHQFWKAVKIWVKSPHVVNRRITGVIHLLACKTIHSYDTKNILSLCKALEYSKLEKGCQNEIINSIIPSEYSKNTKLLSEDELAEELCLPVHDCDDISNSSLYICIQKVLPRSPKYMPSFCVSLLETNHHQAIFLNISQGAGLINLCPDFQYNLKLELNEIKLYTLSTVPNDPSVNWLKKELLPRIIKWSLSDIANNNGLTGGSVNLISLDRYNTKYQELKEKYGREMVKIWPENTDPAKFVFEDVAIASYLLILWEDERLHTSCQEKQSFIDLGCGNGLLVYILASEGHKGRGVDVRKRGIWDLYPSFVNLEVDPVTPSEKCLYSGTDWIIGNHSDELTPWIPVIAARSSYSCRFFLLPCCAFEFDGKKYQRQDSSKSQYNEYLEYVKLICDKCGIKTDIDRLKIPSTKRICLVGTNRLYSIDLHNQQSVDIQTFIDKRCSISENNSATIDSNKGDSLSKDKQWAVNFKPRESVEKVRNCTQIEKSVINEIVSTVTSNLLLEKNYSESKWNAGGSIPLGEVVKFISPERLRDIKKECGGLQTLLKNHHHIFEVHSGNVKLRYPKTKTEVLKQFSQMQKNKKNHKKHYSISKYRVCWFYNNHPDGCPLTSENCSYLHSCNQHV